MKTAAIKCAFVLCVVLIFASCLSAPSIKEYEENKHDIVQNYYAPAALDNKVYKYEEKTLSGELSVFYIAYKFDIDASQKVLHITDYDINFNMISEKHLLILEDEVQILDYSIITYDTDNKKTGAFSAEIESNSDYQSTLVFNNFTDESGEQIPYVYTSQVAGCSRQLFEYNGTDINAYKIRYKDTHSLGNSSYTMFCDVIFGEHICEIQMLYWIDEKQIVLERKLVDIIDWNEFRKSMKKQEDSK